MPTTAPISSRSSYRSVVLSALAVAVGAGCGGEAGDGSRGSEAALGLERELGPEISVGSEGLPEAVGSGGPAGSDRSPGSDRSSAESDFAANELGPAGSQQGFTESEPAPTERPADSQPAPTGRSPAASPDDVEETQWNVMQVHATAYNSLPEQTDSVHPALAAWGDTLRPGLRAIAVSRDLEELGLTYGTEVEIEGLPGRWAVMDRTHERWSERIDVYMGEDVEAALAWGARSVTIRWRIE